MCDLILCYLLPILSLLTLYIQPTHPGIFRKYGTHNKTAKKSSLLTTYINTVLFEGRNNFFCLKQIEFWYQSIGNPFTLLHVLVFTIGKPENVRNHLDNTHKSALHEKYYFFGFYFELLCGRWEYLHRIFESFFLNSVLHCCESEKKMLKSWFVI